MIDSISLQFGSAPGKENVQIELTPITIFVGPNNSGKSKVLLELENYCRYRKQPNQVILEDVQFTAWQRDDFIRELDAVTQNPKPNESIPPDYIKIVNRNVSPNSSSTAMLQRERATEEAVHPNTNSQGQYNQFLSLFTIRLDGTNRLALCNEQPAGDLIDLPSNYLAILFGDDGVRSEVRRITSEAFGKHFVIDPTNIGHLRVRLSEIPPPSSEIERGWGPNSVDFHREGLEIKYASDGIKAFTGIIMSLLAGDPKITLIDEPEAFLHPGLASKLGREIGNILRDSNRKLFASTHSANFLMGCIQSGIPLNIVRLTYQNGVPTARLLRKESIVELMRRPLLRSTGVLNGLFFESIVVTESDSDRAFYQEINERLTVENDSRRINNCLFLNAQNKQTVWEIVKPLRELGIPAAGIVDIDFLKDGGHNFMKPLTSAFVPSLNHDSLGTQRSRINDAMKATGKNMKREGGVSILENSESQEACNNFLNQLNEYGIFVVRNGELESWLSDLGATGHGPTWLIDIFEKMGDSPDNPKYMKPSENDVWAFIGNVNSWIGNQSRKGIP